MNTYNEVEYTRRPDGQYNQWKKLSFVQLKLVDHNDFVTKGRPDYMNPKVWTLTGVFNSIPRNRQAT